MTDQKKYLRIIPYKEASKRFEESEAYKSALKVLMEYYEIQQPYAGNILKRAFDAGYSGRLEDKE